MVHLKNNIITLVIHFLLGTVIFLFLVSDLNFFKEMSTIATELVVINFFALVYMFTGFFLLKPVPERKLLSVISVPLVLLGLYIYFSAFFYGEDYTTLIIANVGGMACFSLFSFFPILGFIFFVSFPSLFVYLGMLLNECMKKKKIKSINQ